jgi:hypothetical protein
MSRVYEMTRPTRIPGRDGFGCIEAIVLCDMHARRLDYIFEEGHEIGTTGCVVCNTATWDEVHAAHMIMWGDLRRHSFDPIEVPDFHIVMPPAKRSRARRT